MKSKRTKPKEAALAIFVSSTYRDLALYRESIKFALEKSGFKFCGMELFGANDSPPLDVCLEELKKSDVYVGVIGKLYGSLPHGKTKSYTEFEYDLAEKMKMNRLMFVLSDDAEIKPGYVEQDPSKIKKLAVFLDRIKKNHVIESFKTPDEVAWKILASLRIYELRKQEQEKAKK